MWATILITPQNMAQAEHFLKTLNVQSQDQHYKYSNWPVLSVAHSYLAGNKVLISDS